MERVRTAQKLDDVIGSTLRAAAFGPHARFWQEAMTLAAEWHVMRALGFRLSAKRLAGFADEGTPIERYERAIDRAISWRTTQTRAGLVLGIVEELVKTP